MDKEKETHGVKNLSRWMLVNSQERPGFIIKNEESGELDCLEVTEDGPNRNNRNPALVRIPGAK